MDGVPVKIAENYKPPPRVYQVPQAIINKLQLPADHYQTSPQYAYDFALEHTVLAKTAEWRRVREQAREARRERREKREQQRLRCLEAQQKRLLGAVSYPNADELSSSESDTEVETAPDVEPAANSEQIDNTEPKAPTVVTATAGNFHNILQPTVITRVSQGQALHIGSIGVPCAVMGNMLTPAAAAGGGALTAAAVKLSNAFNYKDFEEDTSSPFDNIELKTINDLDVLAQVLHNTQLIAQREAALAAADAAQQENSTEQQQQTATEEQAQNEDECLETNANIENANAADSVNNFAPDATIVAQEMLEHTRNALKKVDFGDLSQQLANSEHIPNNYQHTYAAQRSSSFMPAAVYAQQQHYAAAGAVDGNLAQQQQQQQHEYANYAQVYHNQNYLYQPVTPVSVSNGIQQAAPHPYAAAAAPFVGHNANNYMCTQLQQMQQQQQQCPNLPTHMTTIACNAKAHSVPDILKELSDEVRNSALRRARNHSHNVDDDNQVQQVEVEAANGGVAGIVADTNDKTLTTQALTKYYAHLEAPVQKLAKNISSMGFPLERVAKLAQMYGCDDKKIIEHLIPLSELMDLGFEESKISEALVKFDNNKEKALDYLIS